MDQANLSNGALLQALLAAMKEERSRLANVIAMLIEVEDRRLDRKLACTSLFDFCLRRLGMSEGEAYRRTTAARLAKRHPTILDAIRTGKLHLSNLMLIRPLLATTSIELLLERIAGKSKRDVEKVVAQLAPKPDVPSRIQKLPTRPACSAPSAPAAPVPSPSELAPVVESIPAADSKKETRPSQKLDITRSAAVSPAAPRLPFAPAPAATTTPTLAATLGPAPLAAPALAATLASAPSTEPGAAHILPNQTADVRAGAPELGARSGKIPSSAQLTPLSESRHKVQFTASNELREMLERAQSLLRHCNIDGDLAFVIERALALLIAKLEKEKLAAAARPRKPSSSAPAGAATNTATSGDRKSVPSQTPSVPAMTKREVIRRDGEQCTFVSADGERCPARDLIEIDHRHPRAHGGGNEASNLRLLCHAHNQLAAEEVFGRDFISRAIERRRHTSAGRKKAPPERRARAQTELPIE